MGAPAGTPMVFGMNLGPSDLRKYEPYLLAGFAVATFDIIGALPQNATEAELLTAVKLFMTDGAEVENARVALDVVLKKIPQIDPNRIYASGHSSAGTLALLFAASEPRIKAVVAYAPATVIRNPERVKWFSTFSKSIPNFEAFLDRSEPIRHAGELKIPVFLYTHDEDPIVLSTEVTAFAEKVRRAAKGMVELLRDPPSKHAADYDAHYTSMLERGVRAGIAFIKKLEAKRSTAKPSKTR